MYKIVKTLHNIFSVIMQLWISVITNSNFGIFLNDFMNQVCCPLQFWLKAESSKVKAESIN
jgi:hypothetical protein